MNELGSIDSPQADLMNKIEAPLASQRYFGDQYMSACDQICMAIAIDEKCCLRSSKEKVIFQVIRYKLYSFSQYQIYYFIYNSKNIAILRQLSSFKVLILEGC